MQKKIVFFASTYVCYTRLFLTYPTSCRLVKRYIYLCLDKPYLERPLQARFTHVCSIGHAPTALGCREFISNVQDNNYCYWITAIVLFYRQTEWLGFDRTCARSLQLDFEWNRCTKRPPIIVKKTFGCFQLLMITARVPVRFLYVFWRGTRWIGSIHWFIPCTHSARLSIGTLENFIPAIAVLMRYGLLLVNRKVCA